MPSDLFVAAERRVVVNGTVDGDLWTAAQSVEVKGRMIRGDVRVLGESLVSMGAWVATSREARDGWTWGQEVTSAGTRWSTRTW